MSWWFAGVFFAYGGTLGAWAMAIYLRRRGRPAYSSGFLDGLHHGVRNHALWINDRHLTHEAVNGFALSCPECGVISANLVMAADEYVKCGQCGHRIPAPLAPERKEVPHG